jgi:hypothetical protein
MCDICHYLHCPPKCPNYIPKPKGQCKQCYEILTDNFNYITDTEGNKFCSHDCFDEYHGYREKEWEEEDE